MPCLTGSVLLELEEADEFACGSVNQAAVANPTCGLAIDVPEMELYPPPGHVDRMHMPGAIKSMSTPTLEKSASVSS